MSTSLTPEMTIGAPVYVDDILSIGSVETVERVIRNTREKCRKNSDSARKNQNT